MEKLKLANLIGIWRFGVYHDISNSLIGTLFVFSYKPLKVFVSKKQKEVRFKERNMLIGTENRHLIILFNVLSTTAFSNNKINIATLF